jgi:transcriptional regulator with XRE-family HTH domain
MGWYILDNMGRRIKTLRKGLNMTQKQLAALVALDESMINKLENGHSIGSIHTLVRLPLY